MSAGKRVVVTGATGNIGTSVVNALGESSAVGSILGLARRLPDWSSPKLETASVDLADATDRELDTLFADADAVVHLAWIFQPTHQPMVTWRTNVLGSLRVFNAVARCGVPELVYSSSVGAYSPGPKDQFVPESWPTHGWPGAAYTQEKAYLERCLDFFESANPGIRVARIRPAFVFKYESASEQRRLFAGPLVPGSAVRSKFVPVIPELPGMRLQVVHAADIAEAFRLATVHSVRGAFNIAAEPALGTRELAEVLDARTVRMPVSPVRALLAAAWRLHLFPASPDLFDAMLRLPMMDTTRARTELGWTPRHGAIETIKEFLTGLQQGAGMPTPPLRPSSAASRLREFRTGVGAWQ